MKKYISKFHYLTQDLPHRTHLEQVIIACEAGANWIQYRCLTKPDNELIDEINEIAVVCDDWGATLVLTNHYHLLDKVDAQGVHIEDFDADFAAIRLVISDEKTLGASATNIQMLLNVQQTGVVDYCGYGPFAHTDTKPNYYTLLGFEGYRELQQHPEIEVPVIAVGGIKLIDAEPLLRTGVYGIAVSAAINLAIDPARAIKDFYQQIY
ncbi:thiamine-phosphate pyrophosphorylase [Mucilaginibacter frigoritolerans]|jgi:thiamine-phosphate pyrophosphorylase|uniref:Thiamine-phosphate pyrophosphorylase n=1 Tax=Mucilaginibacter frigoritolerans TaxID=652788 RepID=A0A562U221_9SPHI|nr:thiamine phosphate synthase [Mucilaginibacter frigoritolerans]TWI99374.1 thiamine-phosphate pyrophosphorylase [Mucilaginibacter frigoritolerans]